MNNDISVVKVFLTKEGVQYFFWCSFCNRFHYHRAVSAGHRIAHCKSNSGSPYLFNGYILKEYNQKELRELGLPMDYYRKRKKDSIYLLSFFIYKI